MTEIKQYTFRMNAFTSLLSAHTWLGILWLFLLFGACFLLVHIARLVKFGWKYHKGNDAPASSTEPAKPAKPPEKEKPTPTGNPPQEPIYYIVEKKRRAKTSFGEPKQIRFK